MNFLGQLLFPPRCAACNTLLAWRAPHESVPRGAAIEGALCPDCATAWMDAEHVECGVCASRVRDCLCMPRLLKTARVHGLFKAVYYIPKKRKETQNRVVYHIKEQGDRRTPHFLTERMAPGIAEGLRTSKIAWESCVLTYLPRTARAVRIRGIDQSKNLALALSRVLGIPMRPLIRRRRGANRVQKQLTFAEREKNARLSFCAARYAQCRGMTVLLVDDIVTTGAGMAACARILYALGARRVIGVCVAVDEINRDMSVMGLLRRDSWNEKTFFAEK